MEVRRLHPKGKREIANYFLIVYSSLKGEET
jgi:hypothetical protein